MPRTSNGKSGEKTIIHIPLTGSEQKWIVIDLRALSPDPPSNGPKGHINSDSNTFLTKNLLEMLERKLKNVMELQVIKECWERRGENNKNRNLWSS